MLARSAAVDDADAQFLHGQTKLNTCRFGFSVTAARDGAARRGVMTTAHGDVETPAFMPVGTQGAVKAVTHRDLDGSAPRSSSATPITCTCGPATICIARLRRPARFIGWTQPILTDSGGYQVFSLAARRTIDEEGRAFRSHLDGCEHLLTPEKAVDIQAQLGSDIAMVLDECLEHPAELARCARESMERTLRWARARARSLPRRCADGGASGVTVTNPGQAQFGIVQGGRLPDLAAGERARDGRDRLRGVRHRRPERRRADRRDVRHVGADRAAAAGRSAALSDGRRHAVDLVEAVARGIDLFDCVLPTRNARNGQLFTSAGRLNIKNAATPRTTGRSIPRCGCYTCRTFRAPICAIFFRPAR